MKILITGKNSYIGTHVRDFLIEYGHAVDELDTLTEEWKTYDYSSFDAIVHVAAIVHENAKKSSEEIFKAVNTELPYNIAQLAKIAGVKQFVFMSTMAVYGCEKKLPKGNVIDENTPLNPKTLYGKSKLEAEKLLMELQDESFHVAIIRPPNVYGKDCPGNYMNAFKKIALKIPVFPDAFRESRQSMLYIDNLSNFIRLVIENYLFGIFFPQDDVIPNSCELIKLLGDSIGKKIVFSGFLGKIMVLFKNITLIVKLYGGVSYNNNLSYHFNNDYRLFSFNDGINRTFR